MNKENLIDRWTANVKEIYDDDSRTDIHPLKPIVKGHQY